MEAAYQRQKDVSVHNNKWGIMKSHAPASLLTQQQFNRSHGGAVRRQLHVNIGVLVQMVVTNTATSYAPKPHTSRHRPNKCTKWRLTVDQHITNLTTITDRDNAMALENQVLFSRDQLPSAPGSDIKNWK
ncbi:unnamed protein product [Fusarium graminearum]|uniref:Uncharacterized protein n=1 Tax=Gibberella zeae TaxID=5518 RepID=A0A4E9E9N1_GIBZA|nr:unnamed protein product [Fusarium graminearum]